jgi:hypothetical protein
VLQGINNIIGFQERVDVPFDMRRQHDNNMNTYFSGCSLKSWTPVRPTEAAGAKAEAPAIRATKARANFILMVVVCRCGGGRGVKINPVKKNYDHCKKAVCRTVCLDLFSVDKKRSAWSFATDERTRGRQQQNTSVKNCVARVSDHQLVRGRQHHAF